MGQTRTHEEFIKLVKEWHPNIDILSEYKGSKIKVLCKCKLDGYEWMQRPNDLQQGHGCPKCNNYNKMTNEEFLEEFYKINNTIEIKSIYVNRRTPLLCKCKNDGYEWNAYPYDLLNNRCGCRRCLKHEQYTTDEFRNIMKGINSNISIIGEYKNSKTPIECMCKICGTTFFPQPANLKNSMTGCPTCNGKDSILERNVKSILEKYNIKYKYQKRYTGLVGIGGKPLSYDFYLPDYNKVIECQGEQHFKSVKYFGGDEKYNTQIEHDKRKKEYAYKHNIGMIELTYKDKNNEESILKNLLNLEKCA